MSNVDIHEQLKSVARDAGAKLKRIHREDPNAPGVFTWKCTFKKEGYGIEWARNDRIFSIEIKGFETVLSFRLGERDPWAMFRRILRIGGGEPSMLVFVDPETAIETSASHWLNDRKNLVLLHSLELGEGEAVQVRGMQLVAYIHPRSHEGNRKLLDVLIELVRRSPAPPKTIPDLSRSGDGHAFEVNKLPPSLHHLVPLIQKWSIGDDERRTEMIDRAPTKELEHLLGAVKPHLNHIDAFVDSFDDKPHPSEADVMFWLKMAALEAEPTLELRKRRRGSGTFN